MPALAICALLALDARQDEPLEALARGAAADLPWEFDAARARERAAKEKRPVLVYVRCTDQADGLASARATIEAEAIALREDGYAKDLLFRAGPLSSPEVRDLIARRTVPLCVTYVLSESTYAGDGPAGWSHTPGAESVRFSLDAEEGGARAGALRIDNTNAADRDPHNWRQSVPAPSELPASCKLSARVRTSGFRDGSEACVMVQCWKGSEALAYGRLPEIRSDAKWKELKVAFSVPAGTDSIALLAYLVGAGSAWFDDLSIEVDGARGKKVELLANGSVDPDAGDLEGFDVRASDVTTPALLLADADGRVLRKLHRIGALSDDLVDLWLRGALAGLGSKPKSRAPDDLYRDGELEPLLAAAKRDGEAGRVLRARALVRLGRFADARAELDGLDSPAARGVLGLAALREGAWTAAREHFDVVAGAAGGDEALEARFWSAWCAAMLGDVAAARAAWREIAGPTATGRRAAACALEAGPQLWLAMTARAWPRSPELPVESERAAPGAVERERSVAVLVELQRADGSFGESSGRDGYGFVDGAITAICADALARVESRLAPQPRERAAAARERALAFLRRFADADARRSSAMDAFNDPYALRALLAAGDRESAAKLVARIASRQLPDGNWTVYNPERPASFNTALALLALADARSAGLDVPERCWSAAIGALERMRQPSGLFPYSTAPGHEWMTTEHGSIARDPLCEHALLACGRGSRERLAAALERYARFAHELRAPTKRLYDYFNPRGHGGYYFFFAHRNALEAAGAYAEPELARRVAARARELVSAAMEGDGSFLDKFMLGRAYGTAMALLVLE
jgi:hypothetical protein